MGSFAMPSALVVAASVVLGAFGERVQLALETDDAGEAGAHMSETPTAAGGEWWRWPHDAGILSHGVSHQGSGNRTPTEHHRSLERAAASFIEQRRAERRAATACTKGQEYAQTTLMGIDKQSFKINQRTCLNSGAFGDVYATELGGNPVALKQQDISASVYDGLYVFRAEIKTHNKWAMDGFVQMKGSAETAKWGFMYLEMADRGDLSKVKNEKRIKVKHTSGAKGKQEITLPELLSDLVTPLVTMHQEGWAHRDLKLGNILMFQGANRIHGKLADLGLACLVVRNNGDPEGTVKYAIPDQSKVRANDGLVDAFWPRCTYIGGCGSAWVYMPPEHLVHTLKTAGTEGLCTQYFPRKGDVWMLGVMLAELAGYTLPTYGLGWAMSAAKEMLGRSIADVEVSNFGNAAVYKANARNPKAFGTDYPSDDQLDWGDKAWGAKGCLKALLQGMLKPEADRLEMLEVSELVVKWGQGTAC